MQYFSTTLLLILDCQEFFNKNGNKAFAVSSLKKKSNVLLGSGGQVDTLLLLQTGLSERTSKTGGGGR